jgi:hypothetical protein
VGRKEEGEGRKCMGSERGEEGITFKRADWREGRDRLEGELLESGAEE